MDHGYVGDILSTYLTINPGVGLVYYGYSGTPAPSSIVLSTLQTIATKTLALDFTFNPINQYIAMGFPLILGGFTSFMSSGFEVALPYEDRVVTLNGIVLTYRVFVTEYPQNGAGTVFRPKYP